MRSLHAGQRGIELRKIHARLVSALRHAEAAADVDDAHVTETAAQIGQERGGLLPVAHVEHAAAVVRVQADDARAGLTRVLRQLVELSDRHAELRVRAGRADVMVMAAARARIHAHENLAAAEHLAATARRRTSCRP